MQAIAEWLGPVQLPCKPLQSVWFPYSRSASPSSVFVLCTVAVKPIAEYMCPVVVMQALAEYRWSVQSTFVPLQDVCPPYSRHARTCRVYVPCTVVLHAPAEYLCPLQSTFKPLPSVCVSYSRLSSVAECMCSVQPYLFYPTCIRGWVYSRMTNVFVLLFHVAGEVALKIFESVGQQYPIMSILYQYFNKLGMINVMS